MIRGAGACKTCSGTGTMGRSVLKRFVDRRVHPSIIREEYIEVLDDCGMCFGSGEAQDAETYMQKEYMLNRGGI